MRSLGVGLASETFGSSTTLPILVVGSVFVLKPTSLLQPDFKDHEAFIYCEEQILSFLKIYLFKFN